MGELVSLEKIAIDSYGKKQWTLFISRLQGKLKISVPNPMCTMPLSICASCCIAQELIWCSVLEPSLHHHCCRLSCHYVKQRLCKCDIVTEKLITKVAAK